jgi:hypothetical protein
MEFFCYHRDRPGSVALRNELLEEHWWCNMLGRTMWDFPAGRTGGNRYLVLGLGTGQAADLAALAIRDELIACGPLLSDDDATWLGTAVLVQAPDPDAVRAVLIPDRYADIEVHNWQFGGRPS